MRNNSSYFYISSKCGLAFLSYDKNVFHVWFENTFIIFVNLIAMSISSCYIITHTGYSNEAIKQMDEKSVSLRKIFGAEIVKIELNKVLHTWLNVGTPGRPRQAIGYQGKNIATFVRT